MTVKDDLRALIDLLDDQTAAEALEYLRWLLSEPETQPGEALTFAPLPAMNGTAEHSALADLTERVQLAIDQL